MWEKNHRLLSLLIKESFRREKWKETILVLFFAPACVEDSCILLTKTLGTTGSKSVKSYL